MNDYRNTLYCEKKVNIKAGKEKVKEIILQKHPDEYNFYKYINNNKLEYKEYFMQAYNYKCAYCGASVKIMERTSFEIDHFRHKKSKEFAKASDAGYIENLVLSCHSCNRKKGAFLIDDNNERELNPDEESIKYNFVRDDMFYIRLSDIGKKKRDVVNFYNKLRLNSEKHRLDYLLMNMIGLRDELKSKGKNYHELGDIIQLLLRKRNFMYE